MSDCQIHGSAEFNPYFLSNAAIQPLVERYYPLNDSGVAVDAARRAFTTAVTNITMQTVALQAALEAKTSAATHNLAHQEIPPYSITLWDRLFARLPGLKLLVDAAAHDSSLFAEHIIQQIDADCINSLSNLGLSSEAELKGVYAVGDIHSPYDTVARVDWNNGQSFFIKPNSAKFERSIEYLVRNLGEPFSSVITVPEFIETEMSCWQKPVVRSRKFADPYGCGVLLAFAYLTAFHDLHAGNVFSVSKGRLCIVDTECMYAPVIMSRSPGPRIVNMLKILRDGIDLPCILPLRVGGSRIKTATNWGLFGGTDDEFTGLPVSKLSTSSENGIRLISENYDSDDAIQADTDRTVWVLEHGNEFLSGFREGLERAVTVSNLLNETASSVSGHSRIIARGTQFYQELLDRSYHPALLQSLTKRTRYIESELRKNDPYGTYREIYDAEIYEIEHGRIPEFTETPELRQRLGKSLELATTTIARRLTALQHGDIDRLLELSRLYLVGFPRLAPRQVDLNGYRLTRKPSLVDVA